MSSLRYTVEELLAIRLAASFRDGEVGFTGLATGGAAALYATGIPLAAMQFAKCTHAPNLTVLLAGWSINPNLTKLKELPAAEFESGLQGLECEAQMMTYPGHYAVRRGDVDFGFGSGVQVDVEGNINSVCVGDYRKPKVRLVGSILLPEHLALFRREYLMMPHHERRNFVERVDYISGVGYPGGGEGRRRLGLDMGGPEWVVTPKCIFDFDKDEGRIRLRSIHPGVSIDEVRQSTGFEIRETKPEVTQEPTAEELEILRREVDPTGMLIPHPN